MRVKLFEHLEETFVEIDQNKYSSLVGNISNRCDFEKSEITKIEQLGFDLLGKISESRILFTKKELSKHILISKLEDEYYIVLIVDKPPIKCDQMDGLLNYMKTL